MTRQVPIREWSCPNHDYPVNIGYEDVEYPWEALPATAAALAALGPDAAGDAWVEFGMCCRDAEWVTVGHRDSTAMEDLLMGDPVFAAIKAQAYQRSVLLTEMAKVDFGDVRIPLIVGPSAAPE